jgi:hypothetical protein
MLKMIHDYMYSRVRLGAHAEKECKDITSFV